MNLNLVSVIPKTHYCFSFTLSFIESESGFTESMVHHFGPFPPWSLLILALVSPLPSPSIIMPICLSLTLL